MREPGASGLDDGWDCCTVELMTSGRECTQKGQWDRKIHLVQYRRLDVGRCKGIERIRGLAHDDNMALPSSLPERIHSIGHRNRAAVQEGYCVCQNRRVSARF